MKKILIPALLVVSAAFAPGLRMPWSFPSELARSRRKLPNRCSGMSGIGC